MSAADAERQVKAEALASKREVAKMVYGKSTASLPGKAHDVSSEVSTDCGTDKLEVATEKF